MVVGNILISLIFGFIGGFAHDIIQNKRIWQLPVKKDGDIFLGSVAALILGGISGLLVGLILPPETTSSMVAYSGLTAGISLKGLAEAASTAQPPKTGETPPEEPPGK